MSYDIGIFELFRKLEAVFPIDCTVAIYKIKETDLIRIVWTYEIKGKTFRWEGITDESSITRYPGSTWDQWLDIARHHLVRGYMDARDSMKESIGDQEWKST